uniref:Uncharacterized protein n=1 Tax=Arundo donax TaxID=35708 RepID=A0A0A9DVV9_ARUDO
MMLHSRYLRIVCNCMKFTSQRWWTAIWISSLYLNTHFMRRPRIPSSLHWTLLQRNPVHYATASAAVSN